MSAIPTFTIHITPDELAAAVAEAEAVYCDYCGDGPECVVCGRGDPGHTCETCGGITDAPCVICPNCEFGDPIG